MSTNKSWTSLSVCGFDSIALEKLTSSGLTADDAVACGIEYLSPEMTAALGYHARPALKLNYFNPLTDAPMTPKPGDKPFFRLRYLGNPVGFSAQAKKERRYVQPPNTGVCAYFPAIIKDWPSLLADPTKPLLITEGELKAICACKHGFPCIGLGGVYSWRSGANGVWIIPELENINWVKRKVYLVFDSDFRTNPNVCQANNALAQKLVSMGAVPEFVPLPVCADGVKTGLDDFIVSEKHPVERLNALIRAEAEPISIAAPLWGLNKELLYVQNPSALLFCDTDQLMSVKEASLHYENRKGTKRTVTSEGLDYKEVPILPLWLEWSCRAQVSGLVFSPGEERLICDPNTNRMGWNLWQGWAVDPHKGDVSLFLNLVDHLFAETDPFDKKWFLQWLAYPLQYPGTKLATYVALIGTQGSGKSKVAQTLGRIYGKHFSEVNQDVFESPFNEYAKHCQFLLVDDYDGSNKRHVADRIKTNTTRKYVWINSKNVKQYCLVDRMNMLITSNQTVCLYLEDEDRRAFIHQVTATPLSDEWYVTYGKALDNHLPSAVFDYLLHLDLTGFLPYAKARVSQAKTDMIDLGRSELGTWIHQVKIDPEHVLCVDKIKMTGDLYTANALHSMFIRVNQDTRTSSIGLGREMSNAGFKQTKRVETPWGYITFWIVRNADKWKRASKDEIIKHVKSHLNELIGGNP